MSQNFKYFALKNHIQSLPEEDDFELNHYSELPDIHEHEFLIENEFISVDPGMRSRLSGKKTYAASVKVGDPITGFVIGRVIKSLHESFNANDLVTMGGNWANHSVYKGAPFVLKLPETNLPHSTFLGVLGIPGMTAYFGLKRVGEFKKGDHVLVTSAAGCVGATAGQLAKKWGAKTVVGIAGSDKKCAWLIEECGFDAAINYKTANDLQTEIKQYFPDGIDVLFDNVGNQMIDTVIPLMRLNGRIVVSGQTADYSVPLENRHGIKNTAEFISSRLKMQGLVVFDDFAGFPEAQKEMIALIEKGDLIYQEEVFAGIDALPKAFCGLFKGENFGRRLVKV